MEIRAWSVMMIAHPVNPHTPVPMTGVQLAKRVGQLLADPACVLRGEFAENAIRMQRLSGTLIPCRPIA
jgi:hypothetical protein